MNNTLRSILTSALFCILAFQSHVASALPTSQSVPGGIVTIKLDTPLDNRPVVTFNKQPVALVQYDDAWHAVVGLPLTIKAGTETLTVNNKPVAFQVTAKEYPEQRITLKNTKAH